MKDIIKRHILTICAVISIISMAFPFVVVKTSVESEFMDHSNQIVTNGFAALGESFLAIILLVGPILIATMNYIKPIEKYKGVLAIIVPVVCIVSLILVYFNVKGASAASSSAGSTFGGVEAKISANLGIGAIIALLSYICTGIAGAVTFYDFKFNKESLERLKNEGVSFAKNFSDKVSDTVQNVTDSVSTGASSKEAASSAAGTDGAKASVPKPVRANLSRTDEVLALIERLCKMKDDGILTEEEFSEKKKKLLDEI